MSGELAQKQYDDAELLIDAAVAVLKETGHELWCNIAKCVGPCNCGAVERLKPLRAEFFRTYHRYNREYHLRGEE